LNRPITGVAEIVEFSIVGIVFLQISDSMRNGMLTRSSVFSDALLARRPTAGRLLGALTHCAGAVFATLIWWPNIPRVADAYTRGYFIGAQGSFVIPRWPLELIVSLGCLILTFYFLKAALSYLMALRDGALSGKTHHDES
jgi:TRAP-type C4-dicarboxylate transport system permease small subunit